MNYEVDIEMKKGCRKPEIMIEQWNKNMKKEGQSVQEDVYRRVFNLEGEKIEWCLWRPRPDSGKANDNKKKNKNQTRE